MKIRIPVTKDKNNERKVPIRHGSIKVLVIGFAVILIGAFSYAISKFKNVSNIAAISQSDISKVNMTKVNLENLSKKMWLPKESKPPRVFEITDPVSLSIDQKFYEGSQAGDILVVFDESKKAIIYSPKRDVIINSGQFTYKEKSQEYLIKN